MTTITIPSSQNSTEIESTVQEFQTPVKLSSPAQLNNPQAMIGVVVGANVHTVTITTRPVAMAKALMTQRLNKSLELGYTPPVKSTSSR